MDNPFSLKKIKLFFTNNFRKRFCFVALFALSINFIWTPKNKAIAWSAALAYAAEVVEVIHGIEVLSKLISTTERQRSAFLEQMGKQAEAKVFTQRPMPLLPVAEQEVPLPIQTSHAKSLVPKPAIIEKAFVQSVPVIQKNLEEACIKTIVDKVAINWQQYARDFANEEIKEKYARAIQQKLLEAHERYGSSSFVTKVHANTVSFRSTDGRFNASLTFNPERSAQPRLAEVLLAEKIERKTIHSNPELCRYFVTIKSLFIENGYKLAHGTPVERLQAALDMPRFSLPGISYGVELQEAQQMLVYAYFHKDGTPCICGIVEGEHAQEVIQAYQNISNRYKRIKNYKLLLKDWEKSQKEKIKHDEKCQKKCREHKKKHGASRRQIKHLKAQQKVRLKFKKLKHVPNSFNHVIINNKTNNIIQQMLDAFRDGRIDIVKQLSAQCEGDQLVDHVREFLEVEHAQIVQEQQALLKDEYGIFHFKLSEGYQDPRYKGLSECEKQRLSRNKTELKKLNDLLATRIYFKQNLHQAWNIPTDVCPAVHQAMYKVLGDGITMPLTDAQKLIEIVSEITQNSNLSTVDKDAVINAFYLSNGVLKDFKNNQYANELKTSRDILQQKHSQERHSLNQLLVLEQSAKEQWLKDQASLGIAYLARGFNTADSELAQRYRDFGLDLCRKTKQQEYSNVSIFPSLYNSYEHELQKDLHKDLVGLVASHLESSRQEGVANAIAFDDLTTDLMKLVEQVHACNVQGDVERAHEIIVKVLPQLSQLAQKSNAESCRAVVVGLDKKYAYQLAVFKESQKQKPSANQGANNSGGAPDGQDPKNSPEPPRNKFLDLVRSWIKKRIRFYEKNKKHIFPKLDKSGKIRRGHLPDTPQNRKDLLDLVSDIKNYNGPEQHGNQCFSKILKDGKQLWAYVRDGFIRDAGRNNTPIPYNPISGFSRLKPPR